MGSGIWGWFCQLFSSEIASSITDLIILKDSNSRVLVEIHFLGLVGAEMAVHISGLFSPFLLMNFTKGLFLSAFPVI